MAKSKYESHVLPYLEKIATWAAAGASQNEIADNLHIAHSTFKLYLSKGEKGEKPYSDLADCFRRACEEPDDNVEAALYKKTQGYNARVAKHYKVKRIEFDPDTGKKVSEREELVEVFDEVHVPADTNAQIFWLTNRRPDRWSNRPEGGAGDDDGTGVVEIPAVVELPDPLNGGGDHG